MQFEVIVELKPEVLDTQGRAIKESLERLGNKTLRGVRVSKRFVLELEGDDAQQTATRLAHDVLANPVSETSQVRRLEP